MPMIHFFGHPTATVYALQTIGEISSQDSEKLSWLFGGAPKINAASIDAFFIGPRAAMVTPWSTNATEITQNMDVSGIVRIESFSSCKENNNTFDPMLSAKYAQLDQAIFKVTATPEPVLEIEYIAAYNKQEGLALSAEEVEYLDSIAKKIDRKLTDAEVFGFSQVTLNTVDTKYSMVNLSLTERPNQVRYLNS